MQQSQIKSVHFIGIGGVGMSGIARVAHDQGIVVTGSDMKESRYTLQLKEAGISLCIGAHVPENIPGKTKDDSPDVVVVTTAVLENNPELIEAKRRGLNIWHRAQMLAHLGIGRKTIAVAGTHGKTTTSSMLASIMDKMGLDPSFLIGGIVRAYASNAHSGSGEYYVVEADESDKSFRYLSPAAVLVTNVEADHLDHYRDLDEIHEKFADFIASTPPEGPVLVCGEDAELVKVAQASGHSFLTYGFGEEFDVSVQDYCTQGIASSFSVKLASGRVVQTSIPQNPGRHNVLNAAGALGLIDLLGESAEDAALAMKSFAGVRRRFDLVGTENDITVVDDYAHHPTEIAATIQAASGLGYKKIHVLFQPHRYSRASLFTEVLHDEFGSAFDSADTVTFMDVFSAGEVPIPGISGKTFLQPVLEHDGHPQAYYLPRRIDVAPHMADIAKPGDLIFTMGAGDVTAVGNQLLDAIRERSGTGQESGCGI